MNYHMFKMSTIINIWDKLPDSVVLVPSTFNFKQRLSSFINVCSEHFSIN